MGNFKIVYCILLYICNSTIYIQAFFDLKIQETATSNIWVNVFCRIFPGREVPRTSPWMFMSNISMSNMASNHKLHNPHSQFPAIKMEPTWLTNMGTNHKIVKFIPVFLADTQPFPPGQAARPRTQIHLADICDQILEWKMLGI